MKQTRHFPHQLASVTDARRFAIAALSGASREVLETIELMVSELATNCIRHAGSAFDVTVSRTPREIRIEVTDHSAGEPVPRSPSAGEPTGRGLQIVATLSGAWGVERTQGDGKTVWFTITDPQPADAHAGGERSQTDKTGRQSMTLRSEMRLIPRLRILTPATPVRSS